MRKQTCGQVNLTWLTSLTSVATVGIIGGVKIMPQWILNAIFQLQAGIEWSWETCITTFFPMEEADFGPKVIKTY